MATSFAYPGAQSPELESAAFEVTEVGGVGG